MRNKVQEAKLALAAGCLSRIMPVTQRRVLADQLRGEERDGIADIILRAQDAYDKMPVTYRQDGLGMDAVVHLHYFKGGGDWWITERDSEWPESGEYDQAFGFCAPFGKDEGELGYVSLIEAAEAGVELDLYWTPKTLKECLK